MRHVKAELLQHEKDLDDEDDLELEDDRRRSEHPFHHAMQHHHHHHQGFGGEDHLKDEGIKPDCSAGGVPIPATKPKIWSLADTAACKTPPPPSHPHHQQYHHQHHQQHYPQQNQYHMPRQDMIQTDARHSWLGPASMVGGGGAGGGGAGGGGNLGSSFALPSSAGMSPSAAATAPFTGMAARYGGLLSSSSGSQLHYNPNSSSGSSSSASSSAAAAAGFPEVGTDTPPQTPPNMKVATPNGVIQGPPGGYCPGGNATATNGNPNNPYGAAIHPGGGGYLSTSSGSASSASSFSSRLQSSPVGQNSILHQHQTTASLPPTEASTAFKPFYKSSQSMGNGYVSPV